MAEKKKILLIDDDKDFLMATKLILEKNGYEVLLAENGRSGVDMIRSNPPDLAIVDMMMETWGEGFDVISEVRSMERGEDLPLIILSGVDLQGPYQSFEPSDEFPKVDLILHKPVKAGDLIQHITSLLG
ncbi:MAG: response regulator [Deltaproteobacteria bacterium]|nr:response regulator [Deltaproteobacteria bacterium]